jgi:hypothetical protein
VFRLLGYPELVLRYQAQVGVMVEIDEILADVGPDIRAVDKPDVYFGNAAELFDIGFPVSG